MSGLFSQRDDSEPRFESYPEKVHPHMVVEPVGGRWAVRWYVESEPQRVYDSQVAAWDHACRTPFHSSNTLPKIGEGAWFVPAKGEGFTADPRFAEAVPSSSVDEVTRKRTDRAVVAFIQSQLREEPETLEMDLPGAWSRSDYLGGVDEVRGPDWTPPAIADNPPEALLDPPEGDDPWPLLEALGDVSRDSDDGEPVHNFLDLSLNAPSETARAYWLEKWGALDG